MNPKKKKKKLTHCDRVTSDYTEMLKKLPSGKSQNRSCSQAMIIVMVKYLLVYS